MGKYEGSPFSPVRQPEEARRAEQYEAEADAELTRIRHRDIRQLALPIIALAPTWEPGKVAAFIDALTGIKAREADLHLKLEMHGRDFLWNSEQQCWMVNPDNPKAVELASAPCIDTASKLWPRDELRERIERQVEMDQENQRHLDYLGQYRVPQGYYLEGPGLVSRSSPSANIC